MEASANSAPDEEKRAKEAIEEAKKKLRPLAKPGAAWSVINWHPEASNDPKVEFYCAVESIADLLDPDPRDKDGRQAADNFLGEWARPVREAIIPALRRGRPSTRRKKGRHPGSFLLRDRWIAAVVEHICEKYGFNPTRNPEPKYAPQLPHAAECGCSIVAKALEQLGIKRLGESQVARIWQRNRK